MVFVLHIKVFVNTPNKSSVCDSLLFAAKDIASITAKNIDLEFAHKKGRSK